MEVKFKREKEWSLKVEVNGKIRETYQLSQAVEFICYRKGIGKIETLSGKVVLIVGAEKAILGKDKPIISLTTEKAVKEIVKLVKRAEQKYDELNAVANITYKMEV